MFSALGTLVILLLVKLVVGLRLSEEKEREGLDISDHGERAYNY
jgi:Amt family ammonium transporter